MNKYQEALNIFCEQNTFKDISKDVLNENYKLLQELVDKATPKKPLVKHYEEIGEKPYIKTCCPNGCRIQLSKATDRDYAHEHRFCNKCGQAIDWGDEE